MLCRQCRTEVSEPASACPKCGKLLEKTESGGAVNDNKRAAGICAIMLGEFGVHKFVLGYTREGIIMLLVTMLTFGFGALIVWPIAIIEGIIYLRTPDAEFEKHYLQGRRRWF